MFKIYVVTLILFFAMLVVGNHRALTQAEALVVIKSLYGQK